MTATYEKIATTTLGSGSADVSFTSIAGTYTDLIIIANGKTSSESTLGLRFNSDTATNYSSTYMRGNGTTATSGRFTSSSQMYAFNWNNSDSTALWQIQNYSNATTYKTALNRLGGAGLYVAASVGLWRSTSAITSITIKSNDTFSTGSTFTLYGIKAE
jgi:hypothetical protein